MKVIWFFLGAALFLSISSFSYSIVREKSQIEISTEPKKIWEASDFSVVDDNGNSINIYDKLGTPLIISFWASWCSPCKEDMPIFDNFYKENVGVELMMINLVDGEKETLETGKEYIKNMGYTFPVYYDTNREGYNRYDVKATPMTFFINKEGHILSTVFGSLDEKILRQGFSLIK